MINTPLQNKLNIFQASLLSFILLELAGCATLSREECLRADWIGLGIKDGRAGETAGRLSQHQEACADHGIAVNSQQYFAGREQGLIEYCQPDNAFKTGLNGQQYQYVCPPPIDAIFKRYNSAAYEVYEDKAELEKIDNNLSSKESSLLDKKLSDSDRNRIRNEIRDLDRQRERLRDDLYAHQRVMDELRYEASVAH